MLNRGTLLLLASAIALGGGVLLFENRGGGSDPMQTADDAQGEPLLPFEESAIARLTLDRADAEDLTFFKDESGTWQMSAPEEQVAEDGAIAFLLSQLTRPSNRVVSVDSSSLSDFGLDDPEATITLEAEDSTYQIRVGSADFGGDQRYVQVADLTEETEAVSEEVEEPSETGDTNLSQENESSEVKIHLIAGGIVNATMRPTAEWLVSEQSETIERTEENADRTLNEEATSEEATSAPQ